MVSEVFKSVVKRKAKDEFNEELDKMVVEETDSEAEELDKRKLRIQNLISGHSIQRADYVAQVIFVWITQMMLCVILTYEMYINSIDDSNALCEYPTGFWVIISRFLCAIVLHMQLSGELGQALDKMKFALNHSYLFKPGHGYAVAYMSGFCQAIMIFSVEMVNIISILSYADTLNVVICFLALAIVKDFDDFFYQSLGTNKDKDLIETENYKSLYMIKRTTSKNARGKMEGNKLKDENLDYLRDPKFEEKKWKLDGIVDGDNYIFVPFLSRSCTNKLLSIIYRFFRVLYVSLWYYFLPFAALLGSFFIPYFFEKYTTHHDGDSISTITIDPEQIVTFVTN